MGVRNFLSRWRQSESRNKRSEEGFSKYSISQIRKYNTSAKINLSFFSIKRLYLFIISVHTAGTNMNLEGLQENFHRDTIS